MSATVRAAYAKWARGAFWKVITSLGASICGTKLVLIVEAHVPVDLWPKPAR